jgi:uncharacterized membrane protein
MMGKDRMLGGMMLGAGLMYYLDPDRGRRRRSMLRDQVVHLLHRADDAVETAGRDLGNRTLGLAAEAVSRVRPDDASDPVIQARVRSALGRLVSHPGSVEVSVVDGEVILGGPVLADELDALMAGVRAVRGVRGVFNDLQVHEEPGDVPGLQGERRPPQSRIDVLQENWSPATRMIMGVVGGAMALRALRGRSILDPVAGVVGLGMLSRSVTNLEMRRLLGVDAGRRAVDIHKVVNVQAPLEEVFEFWSDFENFPRFMSHLREVRHTGGDRSHWVAEGPLGLPFAWDAETTVFERNRRIGWKSVGSPPIENAGVVRFQAEEDGSTRIDIRMSYNPPAGAIGHAVASFFGADPKRMMDEDLVRFKSLLEDGKTTARQGTAMRAEVRRAMDEDEPGTNPPGGL